MAAEEEASPVAQAAMAFNYSLFFKASVMDIFLTLMMLRPFMKKYAATPMAMIAM